MVLVLVSDCYEMGARKFSVSDVYFFLTLFSLSLVCLSSYASLMLHKNLVVMVITSSMGFAARPPASVL